MKSSIGRLLGVIIFLAVGGIAVMWKFKNGPPKQSEAAMGPPVTLTGKIGGEKAGLIDDPEVAKILARYQITLNAQKAGSVEMIREPTAGVNFLWPASQVNLENFREIGGQPAQAEEIFHSPLVFYSWDVITDALMTNAVVEKSGETYYVTDLARLISLIDQKKKWRDLGLAQFYSPVQIHATDPARSNSGNTWAALLASAYNDGEVLGPAKADEIIPKVKAFFDRLGFMEASSGTLF